MRKARTFSRSIFAIPFLAWASSALALISVVITPSGTFSVTPGIAVVNQTIASIRLNADVNYDVTLRDDNNGLLVNGANSMSYTVKYQGGPSIALTTTGQSVETGASVTDGDRSMTISVPANASIGIPAGSYTATITVEILAV